MRPQWLIRLLSQLEKKELAQAYDCGSAQLFLTGLPRTGTTLVSQYIAHRLDIAYFTNGVKHFPLAPCTVSRWQRRLHPAYRSDFRSEYGRSKGPMAPREAGAFWGRYFDLNRYQEIGDVPADHVEAVRRTVLRLQNIFAGAAFMNKNVKHLLRLNALAAIFPNAHFLVMQRPLPDVAISMLIGRRQLSPDGSAWFSIVPRCYSEIRQLPLIEQIPRQILAIHDKMTQDLARIPVSRVLLIPYAEFCRDPEVLIGEIRHRCPGTREKNPPVNSFPEKRHVPVGGEEEKLVRVLRELIASRTSEPEASPPARAPQPVRKSH